MTKTRILVLLSTIVVVAFFGYFVSYFARGYRFDTKNLKFLANGILVAKSEPDGASIYINGELKGATNSNISLPPAVYDVEITTAGYTSWKKRLEIKKEEVTQITAHLFKMAPSLSPVTLQGAYNPAISSDYSKIAFTNKEGLWVMEVSNLPIGFRNDPKHITEGDLENSSYAFSPDGRQILLKNKMGTYLLETSKFTPQNELINISSKEEKVEKTWQEEKSKRQESQLRYLPQEISEVLLKKSENFTFSADNNMVLYTVDQDGNIPENLIKKLPGSSTQKQNRDIKTGKTYVYDIKEDKNFLINGSEKNIYWLPTSRHLIIPEEGNIYIMDYDGTNKQNVFSGGYTAPYAYPYVTASQLLILTNLGSDSAIPNLYSLTIK